MLAQAQPQLCSCSCSCSSGRLILAMLDPERPGRAPQGLGQWLWASPLRRGRRITLGGVKRGSATPVLFNRRDEAPPLQR
ncbi:hypothetical protein AAFF_G00190710 [Aldrovandia affinis]|uniref:Uncharacterized protein n=1 Tax=Aldrovandia affinis TaxID=143900 RepID=A0AAD7RJZ1_9TELE|nr:hypothetical protein AAFF_G00190710 [Aldrovandia affinis]